MIELPRQRIEAHEVTPIAANYALGARDSVRARFKLYEFGRPAEDMDRKAIETIAALGKLASENSVLDVGASDGQLLNMLRIEYGHKGALVGIDPSPVQFQEHRRYSELLLRYQDWSFAASHVKNKGSDVETSNVGVLHASGIAKPYIPEKGIELREGYAEDLDSITADSVDDLFAMFVLYHLNKERRMMAFDNFKRVLRHGGVLTLATSDIDNKRRHRELESEIADYLGISPPKLMNSDFTTPKMLTEVSDHFRHLYTYDYRAPMVIHSTYRAWAYRLSLHSLRNQFYPEPSSEAFEDAVQAKVYPLIRKDIHTKGAFLDNIHRTLAIASQVELPGYKEHGLGRAA